MTEDDKKWNSFRIFSNNPTASSYWRSGFFLDHVYVFLVGAVIKKFFYLLIKNPSLYENLVNLFEHDIET